MHLVDPNYPKHTRYIVYTLFVLLLIAVFALTVISIARSLSGFARVGEGVAELKYQAQERMDERFSNTYANEETDN
ncbi:TPA: hypothetical protein DDZ10_00665 [Candidatus Uhrbacteria bacterium]|nr:MAG: hypothetical protein A3D69_00510 [Candidatus Uhrbacteria bacterium RIFCSPHIGHO2_02_FULL_54_11]HBL39171.1 hypothetical protein [Candidatus Uhrbacteria bacterium]